MTVVGYLYVSEEGTLCHNEVELGAEQELLLVQPDALATAVVEHSETGRRRADTI